MGMFDPTTGEYSAGAFALDTHAVVASEKSVFESIGDVVTKAVPLTGLSVINSFANTAVDIGNFFGAGLERLSMEEEVGDGDLLDYYKTHEQGIEAAGLLAGSLIPGTIALKAYKLAQAGKLSAPLQRATNIFAGPKQAIIDGALTEINAGDAALFPAMKAQKIKAIALGVGDQAIQGLIYEVATLGTMKASPLLDKDGFQDVVENMFFGALLGGGIGGVIEGIGVRSIFKKAELRADITTKQQELVSYLGKGDYISGDRVVTILDSLDQIPLTTNRLGQKKAAYSTDAAILNSKKILSGLVDGEDKDLTNKLFDVLYTMKVKGGMDKEEMYNYLARLAKVSRVDSEGLIPTDSIFYVNRASTGNQFAWDQLVTNAPEAGAVHSLGYRLKEGATKPRIASFADKVQWEGMTTPKYTGAGDAFKDGADMFIAPERSGKGFRIYVNEDSPNIERVARPGESRALTKKEEVIYRTTGKLPEGSKPLYGAPLTLNVRTGAITDGSGVMAKQIAGAKFASKGVAPVVGDFGIPELVEGGKQLKYGDRYSKQSMGEESFINEKTEPLEANARYVWFAKRGLYKGDRISTDDIAALEQLYREGTAYGGKVGASGDKVASFMDARGIKITDVNGGIIDERTLTGLIQGKKDDLIATAIASDAKLSADEVAQLANVPKKYLDDGLKAQAPTDFMVPAEQHMELNHVKMEYSVGSTYQEDGMIMRGMIDMQYRIDLAKQAMRDNMIAFFGVDYEKFLASKTAADANIHGVGPTAFTASHAGYDTLGQEMENIGKYVTEMSVKRMKEISEILAPVVNALRNDPAAAAELGFFRAVRQRTGQRYSFLPEELATKYGIPLDTAVLSKSLVRDKTGAITDWKKDFIPEGFLDRGKVATGQSIPEGQYNYYPLSPKVAAFERAQLQVNNTRVIARNNWYTAQGLNRSVELGTLYTPPIDTAKYPHFALVKARPGTGMAADEPAIITAETAADLEQKIASLRDDYSVYTKDLLKTHHEVLGDYEYGRNFSETSVNADLQRRGILNNVFPDTRAETIIKDYIDWNSKQELRLLRDHVETGNGQLFAELRAMGERFTAPETSKTGFVAKFLGKTSPNPYDSYIKTGLGISEKEEYRLWHESNEKLEAFFSTAFRMAKESFTAARAGLLPFEEASKIAEKFGLGNPYSAATDSIKAYYEVANKLPPERYLSKFIATANSVLAATAIRLDVFQSVINAVSTPVLLLSEANSARNEALSTLLTTKLPDGSGRSIPTASKLMFNAVSNWFNEEARKTWMPLYQEIKAVRNRSAEYFEMIDQLTLPYGKFSQNETLAKLKRGVDLGGRLTGSELSEEFGRFIAADTGRQIFEAAGYTGRQLADNISTFVNRVHGNYVASQRPIAFQGPIGQAVGLFQTYQFNLMHQLFRYVENGEAKTLAILAGTQSTLFGMQSIPGFQMINNHIVGNAANNPAHKDLYSTIPNLVDKNAGDYLLYGVLSNWMQTGLYSRGDINPRQITILPMNPLDFPAIAGGVKFIGDLLDTAKKITDGGSVAPSLLLGLEHNGLSRPLSGLGQILQGYSSTSKGSLVATTRPQFGDNTSGLSDWFSVANASRLLGARPLDEAVVMDAMYRKTLYQAKDTTRMTDLGQAVKTTLAGNSHPTEEQVSNFATRYAASGGHIDQFSRKMIEWSQDANASIANQLYKSLKNPLNQQMQIIMGGVKLPDYTVPTSTTAVQQDVSW